MHVVDALFPRFEAEVHEYSERARLFLSPSIANNIISNCTRYFYQYNKVLFLLSFF